ncbi:MAG: hypothetical protein V1704_04265 [Candidatus Vogelbacteria bacterium]
MRKQVTWSVILFGIIVMVAIFFSGCNSGAVTATGGSGVGGGGGNNGGSFSSCYAIGFSDQAITDIYDAAINDRANGATYSEESQAAADACIEGCNYEAVCSNGCISCTSAIVDSAYFKSLSKSSIGVIIKDKL